MATRRKFILQSATVSAIWVSAGSSLLSLNGLGLPEEDDFDINGSFIAVAREQDASVTLSEIINHKLKERETLSLEDSAAIENFMVRVGPSRVVFFDTNDDIK